MLENFKTPSAKDLVDNTNTIKVIYKESLDVDEHIHYRYVAIKEGATITELRGLGAISLPEKIKDQLIEGKKVYIIKKETAGILGIKTELLVTNNLAPLTKTLVAALNMQIWLEQNMDQAEVIGTTMKEEGN